MGGHFEVYRLIEDQMQALRNKACKVRPLRDLAAYSRAHVHGGDGVRTFGHLPSTGKHFERFVDVMGRSPR